MKARALADIIIESMPSNECICGECVEPCLRSGTKVMKGITPFNKHEFSIMKGIVGLMLVDDGFDNSIDVKFSKGGHFTLTITYSERSK